MEVEVEVECPCCNELFTTTVEIDQEDFESDRD